MFYEHSQGGISLHIHSILSHRERPRTFSRNSLEQQNCFFEDRQVWWRPKVSQKSLTSCYSSFFFFLSFIPYSCTLFLLPFFSLSFSLNFQRRKLHHSMRLRSCLLAKNKRKTFSSPFDLSLFLFRFCGRRIRIFH